MQSTNGCLVVPPFECAWLSGEEFVLKESRGCIAFESKGDNDVTVLLKPQSGSRRWQHIGDAAWQQQAQQQAQPGRSSPVDRNYTVILGSHRNSCLKFEKDGELCCMVTDVPAAKLRSNAFTKYWINYDGGRITVGMGEPGSNVCFSWADPDPIEHIQHVGLSAWDKHVGYRSIRMHPPLRLDVLHLAAAAATANGSTGDKHKVSDGQQQQLLQQAPAVPQLVELCCRALLAGLSPSSVCGVLQVADCLAPVMDGLRPHVVDYLASHFSEVLTQDLPSFTCLSSGTLAEVLCSACLGCPEKAVFDAVVLWAGYGAEFMDESSPCRPMQEVEALLPNTRFPLMSASELAAVASHPLAKRSPLLLELVQEAREAQAAEELGQSHSLSLSSGSSTAPHRLAAAGPRIGGPAATARGPLAVEHRRHVRALTAQELAAQARFQRRHAPGCAELIYMYDGDHNGVCWFLGSNYGTQQWVNPMVAGRLQVRASSPACRGTDPRALVSGAFLRTNFAGPRLEGGQLSSWWLLDLGEEHSLIVNHYSLRADGSTDFLRSWILQGSNDGSSWADLRRHFNDTSLTMPGQYASWPVTSHASAVPYRMFRVLLAAPNPEAQNPRHVCLSSLELYGFLYRKSASF